MLLELVVSPLKLMALFLGSLAFFHIFLVWLFPLSMRAWKIVDYVWLFVAVVGLAGASADLRRTLASGSINYLEEIRDVEHRRVGERVVALVDLSCFQFERSEWSPRNIKEIQSDYDKVCAIAQVALSRFRESESEHLSVSDLPAFPQIEDRVLRAPLLDTVRATESYKSASEAVRRAKEDSGRGSLEWLFELLSPVLLAFAVALRITKVTGELFQ